MRSNKGTRVKQQRQSTKSEIAVAHYDLNTALDLTRRIREIGSSELPLADLAQRLRGNQSISTFKSKIYATAKYGLLETHFDRESNTSEVSICPLGEQILEPQQEPEARLMAFLNVELNRELFKRFQGREFPGIAEMEQYMKDPLGVTEGQISTVRQVFVRSATQTGLFKQDSRRMSIPPEVKLPSEYLSKLLPPDSAVPAPESGDSVSDVFLATAPSSGQQRENMSTGRHPDPPVVDPAVSAWLQKMPSVDTKWPKQKRDKWIEMLAHLLDYVFDDDSSATDRS